jgi:hypothetical protein
LEEDPFQEVRARLGLSGKPETAFQILSSITVDPRSTAPLAALCASIPSETQAVERTLLLLASQHAIAQVPGLAVSDRVKELFAEEFQFFVNPPPVWEPSFAYDGVRYGEMARVCTLRRFPVGQFQWEMSSFPKSWVMKARQPWKVLLHLTAMGGLGPLFEFHLNARRKNRLVLIEKEANISYYRAARSLEKQPEVRGLFHTSWMFCASTGRVTPRLAWLREVPEAAGAFMVDLGPAAEDSGFMTGSEERRKLYAEGSYRPRSVCILWQRKSLIEWARQHPEFDT